MLRRFIGALVAAAAVATGDARGEEPETPDCLARAKPYLDHGFFLLHLFEHEWARQEFMTASAIDSECAMAFCGEALSFNRALGEPPTPDELGLGWAAIERARAAKRATARDRRFIDAVELLFKNYTTVPKKARDTAYHNAMQRLHVLYRADVELAAFHGLALLGLRGSAPGEDLTRDLAASRFLEPYSKGYPDHPGVANYLLNALEGTPELAERGRAIARHLPEIAPAVPHALHMPAHIWVRLGVWENAMAATLAADRASLDLLKKLDRPKDKRDLHNTEWMMYVFAQLGRMKEASTLLDEVRSIAESSESELARSTYERMRYRYLVDGRQWEEAIQAKPISDGKAEWIMLSHARMLAGVYTGNGEALKSGVKELRALSKRVPECIQAEAAMALAENDTARMSTWMGRAAGLEDKDNAHDPLPGRAIPARELFGEMLLRLGEPQRAAEEFTASLRQRPNRPASILGLARAAAAVGDRAAARARLAELHAILKGADEQFPLLVEAARLFLPNPE